VGGVQSERASAAEERSDSLPAAVRGLVQTITTQLPPFPEEDPALLDAGRWTQTRADSTKLCALELRVYERGVAVPIRSVLQRHPKQSLSARYLCIARGWPAPRYSGPFYVWDQDNLLEERSFRKTDGKRYREDLYQYRPNGLVWAYRRRERNEDQSGPSMTLDEYFDPNGKLAGFHVVRDPVNGAADSAAGGALSLCWLRGERVSEEAFQKWATSFSSR